LNEINAERLASQQGRLHVDLAAREIHDAGDFTVKMLLYSECAGVHFSFTGGCSYSLLCPELTRADLKSLHTLYESEAEETKDMKQNIIMAVIFACCLGARGGGL
jgi:hypothetical protein